MFFSTLNKATAKNQERLQLPVTLFSQEVTTTSHIVFSRLRVTPNINQFASALYRLTRTKKLYSNILDIVMKIIHTFKILQQCKSFFLDKYKRSEKQNI